MGKSSESSVLDRHNQCWEAQGLYVTDGACFPSQGSQNPTLTILALTARACDHAVRTARGKEHITVGAGCWFRGNGSCERWWIRNCAHVDPGFNNILNFAFVEVVKNSSAWLPEKRHIAGHQLALATELASSQLFSRDDMQ